MAAVRAVPGLPPYRFIERLAALPFVEALVLYGSRARGDHRPRSDIDLAVRAPSADAAQWQQVLDIVDEADREALAREIHSRLPRYAEALGALATRL